MVNPSCKESLICLYFGLFPDFSFYISPGLIFFILLILVVIFIARLIPFLKGMSVEVDEVEIGIGNQKLRFRPNYQDRQIAYKVWVELSTRKIGIPIDLSEDVIVDIYSSWYSFFSVTRELIKDIPVSKLKNDGTSKIVSILIDVLNDGVRPHLTKWQAKFRRWYDREIESELFIELSPQLVQERFPEYADLSNDLIRVNQALIKYREKMFEIVNLG